MRAQPVRRGVSESEYLEAEAVSDERHEWLDGQVIAMAGGSDRHARLALNIGAELRTRLRGGPCVPYGSDRRHRTPNASSYTYPDLLVRCRGAGGEVEVRVIFEVLSDSTEAFDRGDKFARYRADPALQEYVLVSQRARRVERFRRTEERTWELTLYGPDQEVALSSLGVSVPMVEIYWGAEGEASDDEVDPYRLD